MPHNDVGQDLAVNSHLSSEEPPDRNASAAPYPQQGAPYHQQAAPYHQQAAPYHQQAAPYHQQGGGRPPGMFHGNRGGQQGTFQANRGGHHGNPHANQQQGQWYGGSHQVTGITPYPVSAARNDGPQHQNDDAINQMPDLPASGRAHDYQPADLDTDATAPPLQHGDMPNAPPGYENINAKMNFPVDLQPPPPAKQVAPATRHQFIDPSNQLSVDQSREILWRWADAKCCAGTGPVDQLQLRPPLLTTAFHYVLESYTETRSTSWVFKPYGGQPIDTQQQYGPPPSPWSIQLSTPPPMFQDGKHHVGVPHDDVRTCHHCRGQGVIKCHSCNGRGHVRCSSCGGDGCRGDHERCHWCCGRGIRDCTRCNRRGYVRCPTCAGMRRLVWHIQLAINYHNHLSDFIYEPTAMPDELVRTAEGQSVILEEGYRVVPLNQCRVGEVNHASNSLLRTHVEQYQAEHLLAQRQHLRMVAVHEVYATKGDKVVTFWIYGTEHKVHAPNYPARCCWCCAIL